MNLDLKNNILNLIDSKREGQYWDFKEKYYDNNASLLHDIICLANSLYKGKKYLIFGISDDYQIKGIENDINRKSQAGVIDFLRSKNFAGDIRPEIELQTIEINNFKMDVLIVFDAPQKPYYLKQDYSDKGKTVRANFIYTRNLDTNTPIDKSADIRVIENMWRERFGLDVSPLEKLKIHLLDYKNWKWDGIDSAYYELFPEFTIKTTEYSERIDKHRWWDGFPWNEPLSECMYQFYYHTTLLIELKVIHCHRENFSFPYPDVDYIKIDYNDIDAMNTYSFFSYKEDTLDYSLLYHLFMGKPIPIQSFTKPTIDKLPFIQFKNENSKENFKLILNKHLSDFFSKHPHFPRKKLGNEMLEEEKEFAYWAYDLHLARSP